MGTGKGRYLLAALAGGVALAAPTHAEAAVTIGSNLSPATTTASCSADKPCTYLATEPFGNVAPGGLRSPIDGVVVHWRVRSGSAGNRVALRVVRPATDPQWTGAGTSTARSTVVGTSPFFATRLRIAQGDGIGLDDSSGSGAQFVSNAVDGVGVIWTPRLADFESRDPDVALAGAPLVQAQVKPDADGDGFGDETQDDCPGAAGPVTAARRRRPRRRSPRRRRES